MITCCCGCEVRAEGCHSSCGLYKDYRAMLDNINAEKQKQRDYEAFKHRKKVRKRKHENR